MNVLLIGSGEPELAAARARIASHGRPRLFCVSSDPGIAGRAEIVTLDTSDRQAVLSFCRTAGIELVVIGLRAPLADGLVGTLAAAGIATMTSSAADADDERADRGTGAREAERGSDAELGMLGLVPGEDLWVFGYGSLMWRPGFPHAERGLAAVRGWHRALCVYSHVHRGTPERPGLVLGLDRGGSCRGVVFRVDAADAAATVRYLRAREQVTSVYLERRLDARLADGRRVPALAYVVDRAHIQYAGRLDEDETLRIVRRGVGLSGANPDYVLSTQAHLVEIGVRDRHLARLAAALRADEPHPDVDTPPAGSAPPGS